MILEEETNLGRVQGAGTFTSTENYSAEGVPVSAISPTNIRPLPGDTVLFPNGDGRKVTRVTETRVFFENEAVPTIAGRVSVGVEGGAATYESSLAIVLTNQTLSADVAFIFESLYNGNADGLHLVFLNPYPGMYIPCLGYQMISGKMALVFQLGTFDNTTIYGNNYTVFLGNTPNEVIEINSNRSVVNIFPVGYVYISFSSTASPASMFGGSWTRINGRFLLGAGSNAENSTSAYGSLSAGAINRTSAGELGGETEHTLTVDEMPSHSHVTVVESSNPQGWTLHYDSFGYGQHDGAYFVIDGSDVTYTGATGGGVAHNNMPPYCVVYMWRRTA